MKNQLENFSDRWCLICGAKHNLFYETSSFQIVTIDNPLIEVTCNKKECLQQYEILKKLDKL